MVPKDRGARGIETPIFVRQDAHDNRVHGIIINDLTIAYGFVCDISHRASTKKEFLDAMNSQNYCTRIIDAVRYAF